MYVIDEFSILCNNMANTSKRASYSANFIIRVTEFAENHGNRAAAREFDINEANVRLWRRGKESLKKQRLQDGGKKQPIHF